MMYIIYLVKINNNIVYPIKFKLKKIIIKNKKF